VLIDELRLSEVPRELATRIGQAFPLPVGDLVDVADWLANELFDLKSATSAEAFEPCACCRTVVRLL
jgi:hypothetical protein